MTPSIHLLASFGFGLEGLTPTLIYVGAIVAFFLSVTWKPEISLYYIAPLLPLQVLRYTLHDLPFGEKLVDFCLLGTLLGLLIQRRGRPFEKTPLNVLLGIWAVFHYVSLWRGWLYLGGDMPLLFGNERFSDWKNYMVMPLIFLLVAAAIKQKKQMVILLGLMLFGLLRVDIGFYRTVSERDLTHFSYSLRYAGMLGYAGENGLAAFEAEIALLLLAFAYYQKQIVRKVALYAAFGLCCYCLLFAFSRGGYLGFLIGLAALGFLKDRKLLVFVGILVFTWTAIIPQSVQERVLTTYEDGKIESSANERVTIWQDAVTLVPQNPILGTGFDTYRFIGRVEEYTDTHNLYLKLLVETGIPGLILFLVLMGTSLSLAYKLFRKTKDPLLSALGLGMCGYIICLLVVNAFGDRWMYLQVTGYFWILMGMVVSGSQIKPEKVPEVLIPAPIVAASTEPQRLPEWQPLP
jgi:putative inorganic carbon (HCO3(-)) transporter